MSEEELAALNESQRALIAARLATIETGQVGPHKPRSETDVSVPEAAAMLKVHATTVTAARTVLKKGTPEEIAAVERGELGVGILARRIRSGMPPAARKEQRTLPPSKQGTHPERIQRQNMEAQMWRQLSDALIALTSLPLPEDVGLIVLKQPNRMKVVEARLARALKWLEDFSNVWSNRE